MVATRFLKKGDMFFWKSKKENKPENPKMVDYPLFWITDNIVVGRAPMSYEDLEGLKSVGIDAIINLCGEFSDLHELEDKAGFEVFWLPVEDETAPTMDEMEEGLEWLDEAVYLGKKVFIHCRHGIGRTGTFVTAYLLRRGFTMKQAGKMLKQTTANPSNFSQWWLLRKYGKKEGRLTLQEPTPNNRDNEDLEPYFIRYERLLEAIEDAYPTPDACCDEKGLRPCDYQSALQFIEALYLHTRANVTLESEQRREMIDGIRSSQDRVTGYNDADISVVDDGEVDPGERQCPLYRGAACLLHQFRPVSCRLVGQDVPERERRMIEAELENLSSEIFLAVFGLRIEKALPLVDISDVLSGRFIQNYFQFLAANKKMDT